MKFWDLRSKHPLYDLKKHNGKILCGMWQESVIVSGATDNKLNCYQWKHNTLQTNQTQP